MLSFLLKAGALVLGATLVAGHGALTSFQGDSKAPRDVPSPELKHNNPVAVGTNCQSASKQASTLNPNPTVVTVKAGETINYGWTFTARHPGPCASYISYDNGTTYARLTTHKDCLAISNGTYTIPSNFPNGKAVFVYEWIALHQYPSGLEYYIQCVDIVVSGGVDSGTKPTPAITLGSNIVLSAFFNPYDNPSIPVGWEYPGTDATVGGASSSPSSSPGASPSAAAASPSPSRSPASSSSCVLVEEGASCSTSGATACTSNGVALCTNGAYVVIQCSSSLVCNPVTAQCDYASVVKSTCPNLNVVDNQNGTDLASTANFYLGVTVTSFTTEVFAIKASLTLAAAAVVPSNWNLTFKLDSNVRIGSITSGFNFVQSGGQVSITSNSSIPCEFKITGSFSNSLGNLSQLSIPSGLLYSVDNASLEPQGVLPITSVTSNINSATMVSVSLVTAFFSCAFSMFSLI